MLGFNAGLCLLGFQRGPFDLLRLRLLPELQERERSAGELREALGISRALLSQHMTVLRRQRLVTVRQQDHQRFYHLTEPIVAQACDLVREAVQRLADRGGR